ncbi:hypothetical protein SAMN05421730_101640 [Anaerobium acetethylicum]|uniref:Uncharacterized protein n=1 Tax=Anaerobium acetethylicum TaxID=1619234 RepID=A0A1D3TVA5_9FIRM|nr:hypothetical protein SAMN05421730_101640 [Anaerobium acetethylicum]
MISTSGEPAVLIVCDCEDAVLNSKEAIVEERKNEMSIL